MAATSIPSSSKSSAIAAREPSQPPLVSDRGTTRIGDGVVEKAAGIAAREVAGVHSMGSGLGRVVAGVTQRVGLGDERRQGVSVEVGEHEAAVDLDAVFEYGANVPQVAQGVRNNVAERIEFITGLRVTEVNVTVSDIRRAGEGEDPEPRVH
jgi:uncharacterized alkaline shock family protein YloU